MKRIRSFQWRIGPGCQVACSSTPSWLLCNDNTRCRTSVQSAEQCAGSRLISNTTNGTEVETTLNPRVVALKPSKTMALTDLANSMRDKGIDIVGLAAGEPDFDTPEQILEAGVEALRCTLLG